MKISKIFIFQIRNFNVIRKLPISENFENLRAPYLAWKYLGYVWKVFLKTVMKNNF